MRQLGINPVLSELPIGLQLFVKPEENLGLAGKAHEVTVRLIPTVSAPEFWEGATLPDAIIRRLDTRVVLTDGELLAIGGLINDEEFRSSGRCRC